MWYDGQSWLWLSWDKTDPPLSTTEDAHSSHTYAGERSRWCVSLHTAPEQPWRSIVLSSGSYSLAAVLISSAGAKRAPGSNTSFLLEYGLCIHKHLRVGSINKPLGSKGHPCPSLSIYQGFVMLPLQPSAQHLWDRMGWLGPGWHSQDQDNSSRGFCFCAASSCGLCSNIHEAERHRLSASPQRRLPRA